jgi:hypothetical protein
MNQLELLRDSGCILRAIKREDNCYGIYNKKNCIGVLTTDEFDSFLQGKTCILDDLGAVWNYSEYPETMKPIASKVYKFMGYIE